MNLSSILFLFLTFLTRANAYAPLKGVYVSSVATGKPVDLGAYLATPKGTGSRSMLILGTYAADFNAIEYAQRLRYYIGKLEVCGVSKVGMVLNCNQEAAEILAEEVDLDTQRVDLLIDPFGGAGRSFGVSRGWLPDNESLSPFLKLFGMLWGLGAWATLPAVIGGYLGNPFKPQPWIEDALVVGQKKGRWPDNALDIQQDGSIVNRFQELPVVGEWKRRPLELATLRLQSMMGISLAKWNDLAPERDALAAGVLTQLGGCVVVDCKSGDEIYSWKDPGICAVANFEDIVEKLS